MKFKKGEYFYYDLRYYKITSVSKRKIYYSVRVQNPIEGGYVSIQGFQRRSVFEKMQEEGKLKFVPKLKGILKVGA